MTTPKLNFVFGMALGGALVFAGMLLGGMAQTSGGDARFDRLSAREIVLVDRRGRQEFLRLTSSELGGNIAVLDRDGKQVMTLGVAPLTMPDRNETPETSDGRLIGAMDIRASDDTLLMRATGNTLGGHLMVNNLSGRNIVTLAGHAETGGGMIAAHDLGGAPTCLIVGTPQRGVFRSVDRRGNILAQMP